jgi:MerR family transcriptional regulator/heat shock protein HspR
MGTYEVRISPDEPVYVISVVSKLVGLPVWTLRQLDKAGVVRPKRMGTKIRLYSHRDVRQLEYVHYLMEVRHVNVSGVKLIIEMESKSEG